MEKVSDYTREKLDLLIFNYLLRFFLIVVLLMIIKVTGIIPMNMSYGFFCGIVIILLVSWLSERESIVAENEKDIMRGFDIENSLAYYSYEDLEMGGEWTEKKFSSANLIKTGEGEEFDGCFDCKIMLDTQKDRYAILHTIEANLSFTATERPIFNTSATDCLWLLPYALDTSNLLKEIFASFTKKYNCRKKIVNDMDHTAKALSDGLKKISKHIDNILTKNFPNVLQIFLSGEEFQIAGKTIEKEDGKKMFLLTGIKTEKQEIILFPTKTLAGITEFLHTRLAYSN